MTVYVRDEKYRESINQESLKMFPLWREQLQRAEGASAGLQA
jgi:hypothetical protein